MLISSTMMDDLLLADPEGFQLGDVVNPPTHTSHSSPCGGRDYTPYVEDCDNDYDIGDGEEYDLDEDRHDYPNAFGFLPN